jgi:hypothetical protein
MAYLLAGKTCAQSERPIIYIPARRERFLGHRANKPNPKECFGPGNDGERFVVRADEKLTAFVELEAARETGLV